MISNVYLRVSVSMTLPHQKYEHELLAPVFDSIIVILNVVDVLGFSRAFPEIDV